VVRERVSGPRVETPHVLRPPVALGCFGAVAVVALLAFIVGFALVFLDSGANSGKLTLDPAESYGRGSIDYVSDHNFYLVRLGDGTFVALADLDAANRANAQRRCRAAPIPVSDPSLPGLLSRYAGQFSAGAAGSALLLREDCNRAVYDVTGVRLDAEGPNLDRYRVDIDPEGRLTVDLGHRLCTHRAGASDFAAISCGR
jgi:hypothetical protein